MKASRFPPGSSNLEQVTNEASLSLHRVGTQPNPSFCEYLVRSQIIRGGNVVLRHDPFDRNQGGDKLSRSS